MNIDEATSLVVVMTATDPDEPSNSLTFTLDSAPSNAELIPGTGEIRWTPTEEHGSRTFPFTVTVTDSGIEPLSDAVTFSVTVQEINEVPVLDEIPAITGDEETPISFTATATDPDQPTNTLVFTLGQGRPRRCPNRPEHWGLQWIPTEVQGPDEMFVTVIVTDNGEPQLADTQDVSITVREVNLPPVLSEVPPQELEASGELFVALTASDPDVPSNTLRYTLEDGPSNASIDEVSGELRWSPTEDENGANHLFVVQVEDDGAPALTDTKSFNVEVAASIQHRNLWLFPH